MHDSEKRRVYGATVPRRLDTQHNKLSPAAVQAVEKRVASPFSGKRVASPFLGLHQLLRDGLERVVVGDRIAWLGVQGEEVFRERSQLIAAAGADGLEQG